MHDLLQNLPESITKEQLVALFSQYPNLHEVRLVPSKKDIVFVEYLDKESSGVAKDAYYLHLEVGYCVQLLGCTDCINTLTLNDICSIAANV
ncbi:uncharacterized protein ARMOST_10336 [Armillaria ostoyae]|uniref:RRM domain-containing protein n=1 Tax=Armillaria ostoyae TaxID=47428 RepID=A0A284RE29_ARMOS|nr:uncharacterized protein ARMOST_10336 [Armillaria ostoyae]